MQDPDSHQSRLILVPEHNQETQHLETLLSHLAAPGVGSLGIITMFVVVDLDCVSDVEVIDTEYTSVQSQLKRWYHHLLLKLQLSRHKK